MKNENLDNRAKKVYEDVIKYGAVILGVSEEEFIKDAPDLYTKKEIASYEQEWDIKFPAEMMALFEYLSYFEGPDFRIPYKCTVNDIFGIEFTDDYPSVDERKDLDFSLFIPISTWKDEEQLEIFKDAMRDDSETFSKVKTFGAVKNTFIYHPKWFCLGLADGEAAYFFLDFAPETGGKMGQVILMNWEYNQVVSPSLLDFFEDFVVPSLKQTVLDEDY